MDGTIDFKKTKSILDYFKSNDLAESVTDSTRRGMFETPSDKTPEERRKLNEDNIKLNKDDNFFKKPPPGYRNVWDPNNEPETKKTRLTRYEAKPLKTALDRYNFYKENEDAYLYFDLTDLLSKKEKSKWYGHVTRANGLSKFKTVQNIHQDTVQGKRRREKRRNKWYDNIKRMNWEEI